MSDGAKPSAPPARESLLRAAAQLAGIGAWAYEPATGTLAWTDQTYALHEVDPARFVPTLPRAVEFFAAEVRAQLTAAIEYALASGSGWQLDLPLVTARGRRLHVRSIGAAEMEAGRCVRLIGTLQDVTGHQRAAEQLLDVTRRFELATTSAGVGVFLFDQSTGERYWDPETFRLFGLPPAAQPPDGKTVVAAIHPDDRDRYRAAWQAVIASPEYVDVELRVGCASGGSEGEMSGPRWLLIRGRREPHGHTERIAGVVIDITNRKLAEQRVQDTAARLSEALRRLDLATSGSALGIWERELDRQHAYWSPEVFGLYGLPPAEHAPAWPALVERIHPDDRALFEAQWQRLARSEGFVDSEFRIVRPDGTVAWLLTRGRLERAGAERGARVVGVALDITERKLAEQRVAQLAEWLQLATGSIGIGLWQREIGALRSTWQPQMKRIYGLPLDAPEPLRAEFAAMVLPEDRERLFAVHDTVPPPGQRIEIEYRFRRPDGDVRTVLSRRVAQYGDDGKPRRILGAVIDVTEMRRAEQQAAELADRMQQTTVATGVGLWEGDPEMVKIIWDDQMYRLHGRTREEIPDVGPHWFDLMHPDDRPVIAQARRRLLESGVLLDSEMRVVLPDGSVRHIASRAQAQRDANGRVLRHLGLSWDVTQRREAEAALQAKELAERANRAKTEFLSRMSHELRTPLNAILGFAQVLEIDRKHPLVPLQAERVSQIQKAGWHLLSLINEVLDLARIESGAVKLTMAAVPVGSVLEECVALIGPDAAQRGLTVEVRYGDFTPVAWADRTRLKQVVLNLLSNAVKYNRVQGRIALACSAATDGAVKIVVRDTGYGMSRAQLAQIFQPFNRLGLEAAPIDGTGIGLTIAQKLVEQMGGCIEVDSEVGVGSEFRVALRSAQIAQPHETAAPSNPALALRDDVRGGVLYIEDEPNNMLVVEQLLALRPQVRLFKADDGASGLVMASVCQPDLILLDMRLPDADGLTLFRRLRSRPETASIPCVGLSANAMPADVEQARTAGMADYWTKPIDAAAFLRGIDRFLRR
jgi:hypothetical protein